MDPHQALQLNDLDAALQALQQEIRQQPSDGKRRTFLFQLYCVLGQWEKALKQLDVLQELSVDAHSMVQTYRLTIQCEMFREGVFRGQHTPLIFGDPEAWIALLLESLKALAQGQVERASALRSQAFGEASAHRGEIDQQPFEWLADSDPRLGPLFEMIINGRYYWVPQGCIKHLVMDAPTDLRDLVWLPIQVTWRNDGEAVGLMPVRYPDSQQHWQSDGALALARRTEWRDLGHDTYLGYGQRMLTTDGDDYPLLATRRIDFQQET